MHIYIHTSILMFKHTHIYSHLHLDVEVPLALLDALPDDLDRSVESSHTLRGVQRSGCHDILGWGNQVDLDRHVFCGLVESCPQSHLHGIYALIAVARQLLYLWNKSTTNGSPP